MDDASMKAREIIKRLGLAYDAAGGRRWRDEEIAETEIADAIRGEPGCMDCGLPYSGFPLDATLPDEQWKLIHDSHGGLLCANCMVGRAAKLDGAIAVRMFIERKDTDACEHDWVDARNKIIKDGEWCRKCNAIRPGNAATEEGE